MDQIRKASAEEMLQMWGYARNAPLSPTARFFLHNLQEQNALFWTVEKDGELIGELYVFLDIEEDRDFADGKDTAYLCAFRVRKEYRHQGLGSRMMMSALSDLKERGFIYATIGVDEERNERFYRRLGFTEEIKMCHEDPCARTEDDQPQKEEKGFLLLRKRLESET